VRVLVTADLHFDIARSQRPAEELARRACSQPADALLVVGDVGGTDLAILGRCLALFDSFRGLKMLVAGNHDLWTHGDCSLARYERQLPAVAAGHGFHYLDAGPCYLGDVAFVGSVGWYDYTYADPTLGVPDRFYQAKVAPGAARLTGHRHLLNGYDDVAPDMLRVGTRWMDGVFVHLPFDDRHFCDRLLEKLRCHLAETADRAGTIVAAVHHLPFEDLVVRRGQPSWDFANAFMGSGRFGQALLAEPKVRFVFTGHSHCRGRVTRGGLTCVNVGSTYTQKRLEVLNLNGVHTGGS